MGRDTAIRRPRVLPTAAALGCLLAGLAGLGAGWIETMANFYADPHVTDRAYFDD